MALEGTRGATPIDKNIARLQAWAERDPERVDTFIELGRAFVQKARHSADAGYYRNANACASIALELKPSYPLALSLRALVLAQEHRFAEAAHLAESVLADRPDDLMALGVLGDARLELGDVEGAGKAVQEMVDLKPSLPSYSRAAYVRWLYGDLEAAKDMYRLALDAGGDPNDPEPGAWVATEAAMMFFLQGDYEGADAGFDHALVRHKEFPPALLGKARVALALGKYEDAARFARRSFELAPHAETARVRGDAERARGAREEADRAYADALRIGRQHDRRAVALLFAARNENLDEALKLIDAELASRSDLYTHDARAWVLYRLGRFADAKVASDRALRFGTRDPTLWFHAGAIALASGDVAGGTAKLKAALEMSPKFDLDGAKEAQTLLDRAR